MSSLWPSTISSLDDSLALLSESLEKLKAAKSLNISEVIEQLTTAAESARNLSALVLAELPEATWQNREDLDVLLEKIEEQVKARDLERRRATLLALAAELARGTVVHRRAVRQNQLNQLRDQAINELRFQAGLNGTARTLPGPDSDEWIEWACGLQEPDDAAFLQTLRADFPHVDEFIANLEPNMWVIKKEITV
ncbi:MAG: hypothetical protein ABSD98_19195 [Candidatus Korobacteraceae bacterium]|jgi:hypothetical protein